MEQTLICTHRTLRALVYRAKKLVFRSDPFITVLEVKIVARQKATSGFSDL